MFEYGKAILNIWFKYSDYRPQPLTVSGLNAWIRQFPKKDRNTILYLFNSIEYISERETKRKLVHLNRELINSLEVRLEEFDYRKLIYSTFDTPGSSSHVMFNLLRDGDNLERKKVKIIDAGNAKMISEITADTPGGIIIYVDDFAGTGNQFKDAYNFASQYIQGTFSEFFMAPILCEEAYYNISSLGVIPVYDKIHKILDRPLHATSKILNEKDRDQLITICREINAKGGLGYKDMAAMVVYYRNAVNNMPQLFRGNLRQNPKIGIFPRSNDLDF